MALDSTVRIFNQFYNLDLVVDANQYDIVLSFFKRYSINDSTAKTYAETLFRVSNITQINIIDLLNSFKGQDSMQVNLTMAYYLNTIGNKTVMFGTNNPVTPNNNVQRNILTLEGG